MKAESLPSGQAAETQEGWEQQLKKQPLNNWAKYASSRGTAVDKPQEQTKDE